MQSVLTSARDKIAQTPPSVILIVGLAVVIALIVTIYYSISREMSLLPTVSNMRRISDTQYYSLVQRYSLVRPKHTTQGMWEIAPNDTVLEKDRLLINTSVQSVRLAGYLGP